MLINSSNVFRIMKSLKPKQLILIYVHKALTNWSSICNLHYFYNILQRYCRKKKPLDFYLEIFTISNQKKKKLIQLLHLNTLITPFVDNENLIGRPELLLPRITKMILLQRQTICKVFSFLILNDHCTTYEYMCMQPLYVTCNTFLRQN